MEGERGYSFSKLWVFCSAVCLLTWAPSTKHYHQSQKRISKGVAKSNQAKPRRSIPWLCGKGLTQSMRQHLSITDLLHFYYLPWLCGKGLTQSMCQHLSITDILHFYHLPFTYCRLHYFMRIKEREDRTRRLGTVFCHQCSFALLYLWYVHVR